MGVVDLTTEECVAMALDILEFAGKNGQPGNDDFWVYYVDPWKTGFKICLAEKNKKGRLFILTPDSDKPLLLARFRDGTLAKARMLGDITGWDLHMEKCLKYAMERAEAAGNQ